MKQLLTSAFLILMGFALFAQAPQLINFQAVARDGDGVPVMNTTVNVRFKIREGSSNANPVYDAIYLDTPTDSCGMFRLAIGEEDANEFSQINWSAGSIYLEVIIGTASIGNLQMLSVPYALYAERTNLQEGDGISIINGNEIENTGDIDPLDDIEEGDAAGGDLSGTYPNPTVGKLNGKPLSATPTDTGQVLKWDGTAWAAGTDEIGNSTVTIIEGPGIDVVTSPNNNFTISASGITGNEIQNGSITAADLAPGISLPPSGAAGGQLDGTYPNPQIASMGATQGQVMVYDNGQWKPMTLPTSVPDIIIIEEIKPSGISSVPLTGFADNSWNQRNFTGQTVPTNSFVTLNGANIKFLQTGTYLISASAPAYKTGRHKLCLRETPSGSGTIKITGTSEYSDAVPVSGPVYGITTRSVVLGKLVVDNTNINVQYALDHYIESNAGGVDGLGPRSNIPNVSEVFAQIMIQKIQ